MFSNSPRRPPVPSRAALQVLYQLAYISSGTAVGVAALCAEERRRRTHYVQKIADNAKRLRQSPRHVHNAAAAKKVHENVTGQESGSGGEFWEEQSRGEGEEGELKSWMQRSGPGKRLVRGAELPSVVERRYAQVTRDHKRVRRRRSSGETAGKHGAKESRNGARVSRSAPEYQSHQPLSEQRTRAKDDSIWRPDLKATNADRFRSSTVLPSIQPRPVFRLKKVAEIFERPKPGKIREDVRSAAIVRHDVGSFFRSVPWTLSELETEARVAGHLLEEALQQGCLTEVRQLVSWKLANDKFTEEDIAVLPEAYLNPNSDDHEPLDVLELFAEVFESEAIQKLPNQRKLSTAISVAAGAASWDLEMDARSRARRLLFRTLQSSQPEDVDQALQSFCDTCLANGQSRRAYNAVGMVRKVQLGSTAPASVKNRRWKGTYDAIVEHAKKHDKLWICVSYCRLLVLAGDDPDRIPLLEWTLREIRRRKAYVPAIALLLDLCRSDRWEVLPDQAKVNFALALCSMHKKSLDKFPLEKLFLAIPEALRGPVMETWCAERLQMIWKTQRSLPAVWEEYERAKTFQFEPFGTAELTLVEICNQANQPDQALKLLSSSLKQDAHNATSLCVAAASMARKSAWRQLHGVFEIIAASGKFGNDVSTSRNLNATIYTYSRDHSAAETWRFVTDMIATIGFAPNGTTTNIMLQCFVTKKSLALVPQWMRYLKTIGSEFQMNATTATKLLSQFYFDQRPPHALLVWFGRNLTSKWPSFPADELKDLIRKAIGYDLRKLPVQDKAALRKRAEKNLARLTAPGRGIPAPFRPSSGARDGDVKSDGDALSNQRRVLEESCSFEPLGQQNAPNVAVPDPGKSQLDHKSIASQELHDTPELNSETSPEASRQTSTQDTATNTGDKTNPESQHDAPQTTANDEATEDPGKQDDLPTGPEYHSESRRQRRTVKDMILALSLRQYGEVMDLYKSSLSQTGLPISPRALEVATEASIRLQKGMIQDATDMIEAAKQAGMEVRLAMGPLLVHRLHGLDSTDNKDANALREMVIDYYRSNSENGFPVNHHVGITAANILINNSRAEYGINILNSIYHSEWAVERELDIVAMTVYLKGFAALKSESGIMWVLRKVLTKEGDMRIDRPFIAALKDVCKSLGVGSSVVRRMTGMRFDRSGFLGRLRAGRQQCIERRVKQRFETKKFGNLLVKKILQCVELDKRVNVDVEASKELEEVFFGKAVGVGDGFDGRKEEVQGDDGKAAAGDMMKRDRSDAGLRDEGSTTTGPTRLQVRRAKARLARAIRFQEEERTASRKRTLRQTVNSEWLKQYRAFMRRDLILADGKMAYFGRYMQ